MNILVYAVTGIFMLVGGGVMISGANQIKLAQASASWPTTIGTIISSKVMTSRSDDSITYRPFVEFSYRVNGKNWTGNKIFFGDGNVYSGDSRYAQKFVQKYPKQAQVTIYYNPSDYQQSVIEAGVSKRTFIKFTFGSLFFLVGAGFGLLVWLFE